jgi:3-hydroxyacyl-CoA dehydrogenase
MQFTSQTIPIGRRVLLHCTKSSCRPAVAAARSISFIPDNDSLLGFNQIGVVGLGLMGHGIAQVAAMSGIHETVICYEPEQKYIDAGMARIDKSIAKLVEKEKITEKQADKVHNCLQYTTDINAMENCEFVIEAVIENVELKRSIFESLGRTCPVETIFASNTSSLSIAELASFSGRPKNFVGVHFFNPVQIMKLVEVVRTQDTSKEAFDAAFHWVKQIKKVPVQCRDTPGFIVNRLLVPALMQAMLFAERGDASVADIDISLQLGAGHPMGPLHLADYIGLDTCLFIVEGWVEKFPNEPAFVIPNILKQLVKEGHLGRKSGRGFYHWEGDKRGDPAM